MLYHPWLCIPTKYQWPPNPYLQPFLFGSLEINFLLHHISACMSDKYFRLVQEKSELLLQLSNHISAASWTNPLHSIIQYYYFLKCKLDLVPSFLNTFQLYFFKNPNPLPQFAKDIPWPDFLLSLPFFNNPLLLPPTLQQHRFSWYLYIQHTSKFSQTVICLRG